MNTDSATGPTLSVHLIVAGVRHTLRGHKAPPACRGRGAVRTPGSPANRLSIPATSGVTGRSCSAGFRGSRRGFPARAGHLVGRLCGEYRGPAGTSGDLLRDLCGMGALAHLQTAVRWHVWSCREIACRHQLEKPLIASPAGTTAIRSRRTDMVKVMLRASQLSSLRGGAARLPSHAPALLSRPPRFDCRCHGAGAFRVREGTRPPRQACCRARMPLDLSISVLVPIGQNQASIPSQRVVAFHMTSC